MAGHPPQPRIQDADAPPCIVLGLESQIGLGIVRELGRAGIRVVGVTHDPQAIGLASRYLWRGLVLGPPRSDTLIEGIRALGNEFGPCCLLAVSEANLAWLAAHRDDFGVVRPVVPTLEKLALVLDKQRTLDAARSVGIDVPESIEPGSMAHVHALAASVRYPVVLKWKDPNDVASTLAARGIELVKAEYAYDAQELVVKCSRYEAIGRWPIVQSYCAGQGLGQFFYMHGGKALRTFQHLRVAEWPPEGGFSSVCDAIPLDQHVALQQKSLALLQRIGWEGVAMVEYRWDPQTGKSVLMEINGRYWGSFPLAVHCQAGFALISYCIESGLDVPALPAPKGTLRCRMVTTEIKRLARIFLHPELIADKAFAIRRGAEAWRFIRDYLRPDVRYYLWDRTDPKPWLADMSQVIGKVFKRG